MSDTRTNIQMDSEKKLILIVEDEMINREMLKAFLEGTYNLLTAASGQETLAVIHERKEDISLVLLDLNLPDMNGMDIIRVLKEEGILGGLPVIVMTADREAEVESLNLGALDFIPKPYPKAEVILARIKRTLDILGESGGVGSSERDPLTGLYSRTFFYRRGDEFDSLYPDLPMDAIVLNINHFHMINERYGKEYGDEVLKRVAKRADDVVKDDRGFACRREADTFLIYTPHRSDYTEILETVSAGLSGEGKADEVVRLRLGVYPKVDKSIDIERRFDRAKLAADTVRSTFTKAVAIYDSALHESAIFAEQLLVDFFKAIEEKQFILHFQPKYDIRGKVPVLNSAEALVRWVHPEFGMISPGVFIPLFEKNGLIQQLDRYVWRNAALQMKRWYEKLGVTTPISVNVSRMDMLDPYLLETVEGIVSEFGLSQEDMVLEVTESAYTEDSTQIIRTVESLRNNGFFIEMDDFGSGYSSLNMLSNLPIDALKLDMQFIRNAFKNGKNTRMLEIVIEIAGSLGVPVIAEGVETAEQLFTLKAMGCDIVQGYYFSKPVPPDKFEAFLLEKRHQEPETGRRKRRKRKISHDRFTYEAMHDPLTGLFNQSAFDLLLFDADQAHAALMIANIGGYEDMDAGTAELAVKKVASALRKNFRSTDFVFRIGEDEFTMIFTRLDSERVKVMQEKIQALCDELKTEKDGQPSVTLYVGMAFGDREHPGGDIFEDADTALDRAREETDGGCITY